MLLVLLTRLNYGNRLEKLLKSSKALSGYEKDCLKPEISLKPLYERVASFCLLLNKSVYPPAVQDL